MPISNEKGSISHFLLGGLAGAVIFTVIILALALGFWKGLEMNPNTPTVPGPLAAQNRPPAVKKAEVKTPAAKPQSFILRELSGNRVVLEISGSGRVGNIENVEVAFSGYAQQFQVRKMIQNGSLITLELFQAVPPGGRVSGVNYGPK